MKKTGLTLIASMLLLSCGEEKITLESVVESKCNCLELLNEEKSNILEVLNCSDEVSSKAEKAKLDPQEIGVAMEKFCPNAALPFDDLPE